VTGGTAGYLVFLLQESLAWKGLARSETPRLNLVTQNASQLLVGRDGREHVDSRLAGHTASGPGGQVNLGVRYVLDVLNHMYQCLYHEAVNTPGPEDANDARHRMHGGRLQQIRERLERIRSDLDDISELVDRMDRSSPANAPSSELAQAPAFPASSSKSRPMPWIQEDSASL
jgi:hypothetical protein